MGAGAVGVIPTGFVEGGKLGEIKTAGARQGELKIKAASPKVAVD